MAQSATAIPVSNGESFDPAQPLKVADKDGNFKRQVSTFRSRISSDPDAEFPAEKDRYVLYLNYGCPWAHRTNIVRSLKGLEDIIQLVPMGFKLGANGWEFTPNDGYSLPRDPLYGYTNIKQLYLHADPSYSARYTVPVLWDKKRQTIVNNESSEIIRMFYTAFDDLLPVHLREASKGDAGLLPEHQREEIDEMNAWAYDLINNGVYKTGFATTQTAYEANLNPLFTALDRIESHLSSRGTPYLFGSHITDADIRLYVTIVRFDAAYFTTFKCNLRMIRTGYPMIEKWLRRLYWDESERTTGGAFKKTTYFDVIKRGYANAKAKTTEEEVVVPVGPLPHIRGPLGENEE